MAHTLTPSGYAPARSPAAMIAAIGIPAGFGALLIAGLAVTVITEEDDIGLTGVLIEDDTVELPPPPPETPETVIEKPIDTVAPPVPDSVVAPPAPVDLGQSTPFTVTQLPNLPLGPIEMPTGLGGGTEIVPDPVPTFAPVAAAPRNDPSRWIVERDYKSSWIRREWTGIARFSLDVSATGRVTNCTITRSTGHAALDQATCALITKRARFEPALDTSGGPTNGVFTSSVRWKLPD